MALPKFDELLALSDQDWSALMRLCNSAAELRRSRKMNTFDYGARVTWSARGVRYSGTVVKFNRKTVQVRSAYGTMWRVSPSLLSRAPASEKVA